MIESVKNTSLLSTWVPGVPQKQQGCLSCGGEGAPRNLSPVSPRPAASLEYLPWMSGHCEGWLGQVTRPARPGPPQGTKHRTDTGDKAFGERLATLGFDLKEAWAVLCRESELGNERHRQNLLEFMVPWEQSLTEARCLYKAGDSL